MPELKQNTVSIHKPLPEPRHSQTWDSGKRAHEEDLSALRQELLALEGEFNAACNALAALHQTDTYRKDDGEISDLAKKLRFAIRTWSQKAGPEKKKRIGWPSWPFQCVTPFDEDYKKSADSSADFRHLVEGFLWAKLLKKVFKQFVWAGSLKCLGGVGGTPCKHQDALSNMKNLLIAREGATQEEQEAYHNWRAQTSRMIARRAHQAHRDCINKRIEDITKGISKHLKGFVEDREVFSDRDESNGTLVSIVASAVELDLVLAQQKANFQFIESYNDERYIDKTCELDAVWMDPACDEDTLIYVTNRQEKPIVQLFRAPALVKYGTSEGRDFGQIGHVILPAEVDCNIDARPHAKHGRKDEPKSNGR